jgi:hypothetical protein
MDESWGVAAVVRDMSRISEGFKITLPRPSGPVQSSREVIEGDQSLVQYPLPEPPSQPLHCFKGFHMFNYPILDKLGQFYL